MSSATKAWATVCLKVAWRTCSDWSDGRMSSFAYTSEIGDNAKFVHPLIRTNANFGYMKLSEIPNSSLKGG